MTALVAVTRRVVTRLRVWWGDRLWLPARSGRRPTSRSSWHTCGVLVEDRGVAPTLHVGGGWRVR